MAETTKNCRLAFFTPKMSQDSGEWLGVQKKILGQLRAFERLGFEVRQFEFAPFNYGGNPVTGLCRGYAHNRREYLRCLEQLIEFRPDTLYIRYSFADSHFIYFLKKLRQRLGTKMPICLEIATYPYDNELRSLSRPGLFYLYLTDLHYRRQLRHHIDKIVTFTKVQKIFGIPTISISNGVDTQAILPVASAPTETEEGSYHFIGVSNLVFWTGYERMLHGLAAYKSSHQQRKVMFHVIGDGQEREPLQALARDLGLIEEVIFHGAQAGTNLDRRFQGCHLAIGNLGVHRKGMTVNPDLKNREYCARGIALITSTIDPGFPENWPYLLSASADESPINISALVDYVDRLRVQHPDYAEEVRTFAVEHFDWSVMLRPVAAKIRTMIDDQPQSKKTAVRSRETE